MAASFRQVLCLLTKASSGSSIRIRYRSTFSILNLLEVHSPPLSRRSYNSIRPTSSATRNDGTPGGVKCRPAIQRSKTSSDTKHGSSSHLTLFTALAVAAGFGTVAFPELEDDLEPIYAGFPIKDTGSTLKNEAAHFRVSEIKQHDREADRKWVVRGTRVFDITDFVESHPGGEVILRACGGSIDPYWDIFTIHKSPDVYAILDQFSIGNVDPRDISKEGQVVWTFGGDAKLDDPFAQDPIQNEQLIFHSTKPCNAETPGDLLVNHFITPIKDFFVRNHFWIPDIQPENHNLSIEFSNGEEHSFTLQDLKSQFPPHTITATLQCSGNRRSHMSSSPTHGKTAGLPWTIGAISTGKFTGARLRDVLHQAGYANHADATDAHVHFGSPADAYAVSIPLATALSPDADVLLAYEMNDAPLTRTHGGPLRVIVPGVTAARSVKWLGRIAVSDEEAASQWQRRDYKVFPPHVRASEVVPADWDALPSIQETPVQSAICEVKRVGPTGVGEELGEKVAVSGFAYAGGGRRIVRVDVSADGGRSWKQAEMRPDDARGAKRWAWAIWDAKLDAQELSSKASRELVVKAVDEAGNTQPASFDETWNFRGLLANAWHRVRYD